MGLVLQILIQLVILVVAMVIAGLIIRWIVANPEKCKAAWRRTKRGTVTPLIWTRATRAYFNWKRVKMNFTFRECVAHEWKNYDEAHEQEQTYYRL